MKKAVRDSGSAETSTFSMAGAGVAAGVGEGDGVPASGISDGAESDTAADELDGKLEGPASEAHPEARSKQAETSRAAIRFFIMGNPLLNL